MHTKYYGIGLFLLVLTCVESICMSAWLAGGTRETETILHLVCGLLIGVIFLFKLPQVQAPKGAAGFGISIILSVFVAVLVSYTIRKSEIILAAVPVDYKISDVLPIMEIMANRWIEGKEVYAIIPEIWGGMLPIYLPTMWMPYVASVTGKFDPRWVDIFFILASIAVPIFFTKKGYGLSWLAIGIVPAVLVLFQQFLVKDTRLISMSDEGVVIGWYMLLAWALWRGNRWLIGLAITFALLSRLSLIGWIPAFGLFVFLFDDRKKALQIAGVSALSAAFLMWISQAIYHTTNFTDLPKRYLAAVQGSEYEKLKGAIFESVGIAKFLTQQQLTTLHTINQLTTFLVPMLFLGLFWRFRKYFDAQMYPIALLKISLVLFFNLLLIPIHTMFFTSCFLSVLMFIFYTQVQKK